MTEEKIEVVKAVLNGVEYMRIPDHVRSGKHSCATAWFRTGLEAEILRTRQLPPDFMRCPKCQGTRFEFYNGSDYGDTTCLTCNAKFLDLGWAWCENLFPDYRVERLIEELLDSDHC